MDICRICRQSHENIKSMITSGLLDTYIFCTNLTIIEDQEKYYKICESCIELLTRFNDFKNLCIESDDYFKKLSFHEVKIISDNESGKINDNDCSNDQINDVKTFKSDLQCDHCPRIFKNKLSFKKHVKSHNFNPVSDNDSEDINNTKDCNDVRKTSKPELHCEHCPRKFKSELCFKKHLKCHNSDAEPSLVCNNLLHHVKKEDCLENGKKGKLFNCPVCKKQILKNSSGRHMKTHEQIPLQCRICQISFLTNKELVTHCSEAHIEIKIYQCPECPSKFIQSKNLQSHMLKHSTKRPFDCSLCDKKFKCNSNLKQHMKNHPTLNCHICEKTCANKVDFRIHILNHMDTNRYKCKICETSFIHLSSFKEHIKSDHVDLEMKDCLEELQGFKTEVGNGSKLKSESHPCHICGKIFKHLPTLKIHLRRHNGEKPFSCDGCNHKFVDQSELLKHRRRMHENLRNYKCKHCSYSGITSNDLTKHLLTHTDEKPYVCKICNNAYKSSKYLMIHNRSHTGEKPYSCTHCEKSFAAPSYLKLHMYTHTGEKRFACEICDKKFTQRTPLMKHMLIHQNDSKERTYD